MAKSNKSKWMIGLTGTALSVFVIGQIGANENNDGQATMISRPTKTMSKQEQEYVQLDWTNYELESTALPGVEPSDRQTRRS